MNRDVGPGAPFVEVNSPDMVAAISAEAPQRSLPALPINAWSFVATAAVLGDDVRHPDVLNGRRPVSRL
ncbi:MAG: hypothetical protein ABW061_09360 [Polyangiaceae bacterium]